jgi:hypothetical protein
MKLLHDSRECGGNSSLHHVVSILEEVRQLVTYEIQRGQQIYD